MMGNLFDPAPYGLFRTWPGYLLIMAMACLPACKARQAAAPVEVPVTREPPKPDWVTARPVSSAAYTGIGLASKSRPDYQETAKKNALNDLASEISVRVEGNSLLHTLDRKYKFDEEFTSTIRTSTQERLEGYELVDTYENADEYWTYYRLGKEEHARIKAERKRQAIEQATDLYQRAVSALATGDLRTAFDLDLRALVAMKDYWGENDQVVVAGRTVPLANELFNDLQHMAGGVRLAALPERCALDWSNHFRRELLITATFADGGRSLPQLPITIRFPGAAGRVVESRNTDAEGRARTTIQRVDLQAPALEVVVAVDIEALVSKELDPAFTAPLLGSLTVPEVHVPIDRIMPKVYFKGTENNLGQAMGGAPLALAMKEELTARGFRTVERAADADLVVDLEADTRTVGESNGFHTVVLHQTLKVTDRRTGETVHEAGKQDVKGIQLDFSKAGLDAYKKAALDVRTQLVPALLNTLFQR
ncbi:MAG: LPP20 family lipoprotein [Flavobacteriales bacterium]|nr:LPP20 family lipoprotein [Flavobacteriales bacterium]